MDVEDNNNNDVTPIVIENGSQCIKAGFAGDDAPRAVFPSIVGRSRYPHFSLLGRHGVYAGDEAHSKRGILSLKYPIEHGIITNWDDMEKLWHHTFHKELRVDPVEHPVLLIDAPLSPKVNREKITQIFFETFNSPSMYLSISQVLSLYSLGCTTGLVVDSGLRSTRIVPVYRGQVVTAAVASLDMGGAHLTDYMLRLICESGYSLTGSATETEVINDMKEKLCYVSANRGENSERKRVYELPDGQEIKLSSQCSRCPEPIFQPSLLGLEESLPMSLHNTIHKFDEDFRKHLSSNIVLAGGNTLFPGMADRLRAELSILSQGEISNNVISPPERRYSSWIGGSLLGSFDGFDKICLSKQCYDEYGPKIASRKFF